MAFTRRFTRRRRNWRKRRPTYVNKKRYTKKKFSLTKTLNYKGVVFFRDKAQQTVSLTANTGTTNTYTSAFVFSLSNLSNMTAYTALFRSYMITGVKITWFPVAQVPTPETASGTGPSNAQGSMQLFYKPDYQDVTPWPSYTASLQQDPKVVPFNDYKRKCFFRPRPRSMVWEDQNATMATVPQVVSNIKGAQTSRKDQQWLSTRNGDQIQHWGLKWGIHNIPNVPVGGTPADCEIVATYYIAFKDRN